MSPTTTVRSPFAGTVSALSEVPDPVFSNQLLGAGVALLASDEAGSVVASAPIDGTIAALHPHAFAIQGADGLGVLVHIGIDTVRMAGEGFELLAAQGDPVSAGDPVVRFEPFTIIAAGHSAVCPVVVLESAPDSLSLPAVGQTVAAGDALYTV